MTREQVNRVLRQMERVREDAGEADTPGQARRRLSEYARLWKAIKPYVLGDKPYADASLPLFGEPT